MAFHALHAYASEHFVTLVPEIDLPGHKRAAFIAYPELAPAGLQEASSSLPYGLSISYLDVDSKRLWQCVGDVLDAVIDQFLSSAYLHISGYEPIGMSLAKHSGLRAEHCHAVEETFDFQLKVCYTTQVEAARWRQRTLG